MMIITIHVTVTVLETENTLCHAVLSSLQKDATTHDVTFKTADGGSLGAHRAIIAASSPVFYAMLYGKSKESTENEIYLSSIDTNMLKLIFRFIYTGVVEVNSDECMGLLQTAHYLDLATLETKCGEMLVSTLDVHVNFSSIITFAIDHQMDLLFKQCLDFMEINADKVIHSLEFNALPLRVILAFLKSSNLEVREIDLFLAVAKWFEHQKSLISADDKEQVFQLIRYPLISLADLLNRVRPLKLANQNFYTAALEYHNMNEYDEFSPDQLALRKYYFNFSSFPGLSVEQTREGTVIHQKHGHSKLCCIAKFCPAEASIRFKINRRHRHSYDSIFVGAFSNICIQRDALKCVSSGEGSIKLIGDVLTTTYDGAVLKVSGVHSEDTCMLCVFMSDHDDPIMITRL